MPAETLEVVQKREKALAQKLQEKREGLDPQQLRSLQKKVRRAQRKRRRLNAEAERRAKASQKKAGKAEESAES